MPEFKSYTVTFDPNGGTINGSAEQYNKKVLSGSKVGELPTAVREGYKFLNWKRTTGEIVTSNTKVTMDFVCYAQWEQVANCYVNVNGKNTLGMAYIKQNGKYVSAKQVYVRDNGKYKPFSN